LARWWGVVMGRECVSPPEISHWAPPALQSRQASHLPYPSTCDTMLLPRLPSHLTPPPQRQTCCLTSSAHELHACLVCLRNVEQERSIFKQTSCETDAWEAQRSPNPQPPLGPHPSGRSLLGRDEEGPHKTQPHCLLMLPNTSKLHGVADTSRSSINASHPANAPRTRTRARTSFAKRAGDECQSLLPAVRVRFHLGETRTGLLAWSRNIGIWSQDHEC
jgi:hypothetical protein